MAEQTLTIKDAVHSALGPSSSSRWLNCPGSHLLTADIPSVSSTYAMEGTAAHGVAEECDRLDVRADHFLGYTVCVDRTDGKSVFTCDQEMVDGVNFFLDYVDDLPGISLCEMTVQYTGWVPGGFGTLDRAKINGETAHIVDFKYGQGVMVSAYDNSQLKLYGLGFYQEWSWLFPEVKTLVLHIVQPRLDHVDRFEIPLADVLEWAKTVVAPRAQIALRDRTALKAGEWCRWCKIKATCMARAAYVMDAVVDEFEDLDKAIGQPLKTLGSLTNDQIARILPKLDSVENWCKSLKAHASAEIAAGREIGGWKLTEGRSNRAWGATEAEICDTVTKADFTPEIIYGPAPVLSPAQLEKRLGKHKNILKPLIVKPPGKPTLAPVSDPRPALAPGALTEFEDLDA